MLRWRLPLARKDRDELRPRHTSTISQVLNRGTPSPADEVYLHKGQSWISITSPTEGTSDVVVWAPNNKLGLPHHVGHDLLGRCGLAISQQHRRPIRAAATADHGGHAGQGTSISGWIVRYDIVDGPPAVPSRNGATTMEVRTDGAGGGRRPMCRPFRRSRASRRSECKSSAPEQFAAISRKWLSAREWPACSGRCRGWRCGAGSNSITADGAIGYRVTNSGDLDDAQRGFELHSADGRDRAQQHARGPALWPAIAVATGRSAAGDDERRRAELPGEHAGRGPQRFRGQRRSARG